MARTIRYLLSFLLVMAAIVGGYEVLAQGNGWTVKAPMPVYLDWPSTGVVDDALYVTGSFCEAGPSFCRVLLVYYPALNSWSFKAPPPTMKSEGVAGVINGLLYVLAGSGDARTIAYDPETNTWANKGYPPVSPRMAGAGVVNGILYVVGGLPCRSANDYCSRLWAYNPATNTWTQRAPIPTPRYRVAVGVVDGILYVAGGGGCQDESCTTLEAYDPATNTWETKSPMPTAQHGAAAGVVDGILYLAGGECPNVVPARYCGTVQAYNPMTNSWTELPPMPFPVGGARAGVAGNVLYVVGGFGSDAQRVWHSTMTQAFRPEITVVIDIRPGGTVNPVNTRSQGLIPVAILSSLTFDAPAVVNESSVKFGRTGTEESLAFCNASGEDVDFDGLLDLVCHFFTQETGFRVGDSIGILTGETLSHMQFRGSDSIRVVR